ncbi:kinesin-domain-containing protein [Trichodelitschia bisporula]|uniref:Kinesin-like protein n=1 Tax=Trichodelitschia bisporula TaxID=703511 RepID=A0A6G1HL64_9PEZI|nr:kinesin-domain-containing protein [Trichodelitschia bisporula]
MEKQSSSVKVVVRVRRFVQRELDAGSPCLIKMDPTTQSTTLMAPAASDRSRKHLEDKTFTFDKSFWSHDPGSAHYAEQADVYRSFGEEFLDHNFEGFHTCIFAYGQTGSGKSYTMMGTPQQPGLIPRTCEALFQRIKHQPVPNTTYNVHVSYFEVYNEHVRDLLVGGGDTRYLKIRESPADGVYIQGLTDATVRSYADVEELIKKGDKNRTVAATKMNDTSSRSHAVFTICLKQIQHSLTHDETVETTSRMRLVDLAGSERANKTEATGQRLVEGGLINKSLTTLGRVIAALADQRRVVPGGSGRNSPRPGTPGAGTPGRRMSRLPTNEVVPYRDSVLTWLLKDSLGGNSKTAMVACVSPTDYEETLSTLRYADQAKRIRMQVRANVDAITAKQRDDQISAMAATIKNLQLSVNRAAERKKEEMESLEDYQRQVDNMQRLMEETRQVSDARIRALTLEVEELRPTNVRLRGEIETLRRHLGLVVGELKHPIVIPAELRPRDEDAEREEAEKEAWALELQHEAEQMLRDLKLFRRKVKDDKEMFPIGGPLVRVGQSEVF